MLSKDTLFRLEHAVTDSKVGDEIAARLISATPGSPSAAQAVLNILDPSSKMNAQIAERLFVGLAGDANGRAGKELAKKINGMVAVLKAQADGNEVPATFAAFSGKVTGMATNVTIGAVVAGPAGNVTLLNDYVAAVAAQFSGQVAGMTTDVVLNADVPGAAGNITLVATPGFNITDLMAAWNLANPTNTVSYQGGNASQEPTADIVFVNGADSTGSTVSALISAWNIAFPANTLTLSAGNGAQVPQANIVLSGGVSTTDANLVPAKAAMGSDHMSSDTFECLVHALADRPAAVEFKAAYDAMVDAVQAIA
jgi:hypothetical protein